MRQIYFFSVLMAMVFCTFAQEATNPAMPLVVRQAADQPVLQAQSARGFYGQRQNAFKGSIFTKAPVFTEDFSTSNYSVGQTTGPQYQTAAHARWQYVGDPSQQTLASAHNQQLFPVLFGAAAGGSTGFSTLVNDFVSQTPNNGFMVMSMQDQIGGWGGTGSMGIFDSWIAFNKILTNANTLYDISFYQGYRRFNLDSCFVEYSSDSVNWHSIYINRKAIDISVNSATWGTKTVSLPASVANNPNLYVRIRWYSDSDTGGAYGYYWMIDDFSVETSTRHNRLTVDKTEYLDGFYHLVPQGMGGNNFVWKTRFRNNGAITHNNVVAKIKHRNTVLAQSQTMAQLLPHPNNDTFATIDPLGRLGDYYNGSPTYAQGTAGRMPSTTAGLDTLVFTLSSDSLDIGIDTFVYRVTNDSSGNRIWGRDNGVLVNGYCWCPGYRVSDSWGMDCYSFRPPFSQGYIIAMMYGTPDTVPSNWVIRGVEIVPSSILYNYSPGQEINAVLYSVSQGQNSFSSIPTGAPINTVQASDISQNYFGYEDYGTYNAIRIFFPNQPTLQSNQYYYIGYQTVNGQLFPAIDCSTYFRPSDTAAMPLPNLIGGRFGAGAQKNIFVNDLDLRQSYMYGETTVGATPMIRMIVGPRQVLRMVNVTWTVSPAGHCEVYDMDGLTLVTGQTISVPEHSIRTFWIQPDLDNGYDIDSVFVNGVAVDLGSDPRWALNGDGGYLTLDDIQSPQTCSVVVRSMNSLQTADNVRLKLSPNPASATTGISIQGYSGTASYSVIDVNGRVVESGDLDCKHGKLLHLDGLARGTYFVRVTADAFSKVEKLMVR